CLRPTSGLPSLEQLRVENSWAPAENAPEKLRLRLHPLRHLLSELLDRQRKLCLPARRQSMASWCAGSTFIIQNRRKSSSIICATWRARPFSLLIQKLPSA